MGEQTNKVVTVLLKAAIPAQNALYGLLVMLGIVGNGLVMGVVGRGLVKEGLARQHSDIILLNLVLSNLLVSLVRNIPLLLADVGLQLFTSPGCCQFLMFMWVWLRSVNVWMTMCLSAFHFLTLCRLGPVVPAGPHGPRASLQRLLLVLALIWSLNLLYSFPGFFFSTQGGRNSTEELMLVSSTTRPLLGCVWSFPSRRGGLAYATTSLVLHELLPILLMVATNLGTLHTLARHGRSQRAGETTLTRRIPAERRAAKVVLVLIMLFIISWGASVLSVNYYNYNRGPSTEFLLVMARFTNSLFIAFSPLVLLAGHSRLKAIFRVIADHVHSFCFSQRCLKKSC
nr:PREDICTED: neuropeptide F receptor-like [Lepisosteus oculatus]